MGKKTEGKDQLCKIFDGLYDENRKKIVRLAEGLLLSQNELNEGKKDLKEENKELKSKTK